MDDNHVTETDQVRAGEVFVLERVKRSFVKRAASWVFTLFQAAGHEATTPAWRHYGQIRNAKSGELVRTIHNRFAASDDLVREVELDLEAMDGRQFASKWGIAVD